MGSKFLTRSPNILLGNIPPHYDRKKLYGTFSIHGKVTKLFISPNGDYGNVYFESAEVCEKTFHSLKSNPELNISLRSSRGNNNSSRDSNSTESLTVPTRDNEENDVDTRVVKDFVDVYGRLVTTLRDDDGNVYVSLSELKHSGFQLFERGTLAAREGSHLYNQQKLDQFELFMKAKANEFMSQYRFNPPAHAVNEIIEKEKKSFFGSADRGRSNPDTRSSDYNSRDCGRPRYQTGKSNYNEQKNSDSNNWDRNGNENDRGQNQNSYSQINQSRDSKGTNMNREKYNDTEKLTGWNSVEKEGNNTVKPLIRVPIKLDEPQETKDGTYMVNEVTTDTPICASTPVKDEHNLDLPTTLRKPHHTPSTQQAEKPEELHVTATPLQAENKSETKPKRNLVIETICDAGVFQFCEKTSDHTFTGFALPNGFEKEFELLSEIGSHCTQDPKYSPKVGDIVAVDHDTEMVRALILTATENKYTCVLIDYGLISVKEKVQLLPEKYVLIPEFSFECEADASIIQKLQDFDNGITLKIMSPGHVSLLLKSGEIFEFIGKPIQDRELGLSQTKTIPSLEIAEVPTVPSIAVPQKKSTTESVNEIIFTPRKLVIDELSNRGTFDFIEKTSNTSFTCFICPEDFLTELNQLEMMYKDTTSDKSFKPEIGDIVAVNSADNGVVRAIILNVLNDQYECALIDYGTKQQLSDVRPLPEKYINIPEFVCECKADADIVNELSNLACQSMRIKVPGTLEIKLENGKQHVIKGYRWKPVKAQLNGFKPVSKSEVYKRPEELSLKDNDKVMIVGTQDNAIFVRNRECHITFTGICEALANYKGTPFQHPEVGCLALCSLHDNNLYRVVINKINGTTATVNYIDCCNVDTVPIDKLKNIPEKIAKMNSTLIKIGLKDFTQHTFNEEMLKELSSCSKRREKFNASKVSNENIYDLIAMDDMSLTERLNKLQKGILTPKVQFDTNRSVTPQSQGEPQSQKNKSVSFNLEDCTTTPKSHKVAESVCRYQDITKTIVKPGDMKLLCTYAGGLDEGLISCCKADEESNMLMEFIATTVKKYVDNDTSSYNPTQGEVCLARFDGEWYRATVLSIENNRYEVYFIDYGNHTSANPADLRKLPPELSKAKALAMICKLDGVNVNDSLLRRLKDDIIETEVYNTTITSVSCSIVYLIIPALMKQWKNDGLI